MGVAGQRWALLVNCGSACEEAQFRGTTVAPALEGGLVTERKLQFPAFLRCQNYLARKPVRDLPPSSASRPPENSEAMNSRQAWRLLLSRGRGDRWVSSPRGHFSPALRRGEARRRVIDVWVLSRETVPVGRACSSERACSSASEREEKVPRPPPRFTPCAGDTAACCPDLPSSPQGARTEEISAFLFLKRTFEGQGFAPGFFLSPCFPFFGDKRLVIW